LYKIVRRPPGWKSTARLARRARLDLLDKVERVESSRAKWNLSLTQLGAYPDDAWCTKVATLNSTHCHTRSQCRCRDAVALPSARQ